MMRSGLKLRSSGSLRTVRVISASEKPYSRKTARTASALSVSRMRTLPTPAAAAGERPQETR
uniref:Uncharacterized protein n=1 Tax=Arundo donax TaxID=35708 RepID=A0A0A9BHQ7_ARUDO